MEYILSALNFILHFEVYLDLIIQTYHGWAYLFLFLIVFLETGVVVFPFLPGDSLLFAIGAFAARGSFDFMAISLTLFTAALIGDNLNYTVGRKIGARLFTKEDSRLFNKAHLDRAHAFYEKYGAKTIILARFIPIVRTFAPFVAGVGRMTYKKFILFSVLGAGLWIFSFIPLGYFFGNLPAVKQNFKVVMLVIILISVAPALIELIKVRLSKNS